MRFDPGYYINMFKVIVPEQEIEIMICERSKYSSLKKLRNEINKIRKNVFVYAPERSNKVYGYGDDMSWLLNKGFTLDKINLYAVPKLTGRMILEGVINRVLQIGFIFLKNDYNVNIYQILDKNKGRIKIYNPIPKITSDNNVKVFIGYDLRVIYLRDMSENKLNFGLVVDIVYALRDVNNIPLNYHIIVSKFGHNILKEIRQIQKDLIPTGINREVAKQRLVEDIIPFVQQLSEIELPCGIKIEVTPEPCRIILGDKNEVIW